MLEILKRDTYYWVQYKNSKYLRLDEKWYYISSYNDLNLVQEPKAIEFLETEWFKRVQTW